jgi:hypothetical protein
MIFGRAVFSVMKEPPRSNESNVTMLWPEYIPRSGLAFFATIAGSAKDVRFEVVGPEKP